MHVFASMLGVSVRVRVRVCMDVNVYVYVCAAYVVPKYIGMNARRAGGQGTGQRERQQFG